MWNYIFFPLSNRQMRRTMRWKRRYSYISILHSGETRGRPLRSWAVNRQIIIRDRPPRSHTRAFVREIFGPTYGNTIEANGNLIPRRGWSSIAGPNGVCKVAELNFEGSYGHRYGCIVRAYMVYTHVDDFSRCVFCTRRCMHNFLRTNQLPRSG